MVVKLRPRIDGRFIKETVFMGPDEGHLQNSGELVYESIAEWQLFGCALLMGAAQMNGQLTVINEGNTPAFVAELAKLVY